MLTFDHPWTFWLLALPLLVHFLVPPVQHYRPTVRVPFLRRLIAARGNGEIAARRHPAKLISLVLIWILVITALARPLWLEPAIERIVPTRDLLLLIDLSGSMDHEDFTNADGETVNRLVAVREVMGDFLMQRKGDRVGLVVFGSSPFLQVPFTSDLELCRQLLDETEVGMAGPRTALGDALGLGISLFDHSQLPTKTIIALTDGNDTASQVPPVEAARIARDRDIRVHTIAVGDPTTVGEEKLDQDALKAVSNVTGGEYFLALNREELSNIYDTLDDIETREEKTISHRPRRNLYYWPLAMALLLSLLSQLIPTLWKFRLETSNPRTRLAVNPHTFELETVDQ